MLTLDKILDKENLLRHIDLRNVRRQFHPTEPLAILNYTDACAWEGNWDTETMQCRGLIYNIHTLEVVSRPFRKFFNFGEPRGLVQVFPLDQPIRVQEKMDGSLGIIYQEPTSGQFAIATRGSFTSEQAVHATEILRTKYADFVPYAGFTYLVEIVYPENRIVVDYGGMDDLVLIDVINNETGLSALGAMIDLGVPFPVAWEYSFDSITEINEHLAEEIGSGNEEGFVVYFKTTGDRLKFKYEEYKRLHKLMTGVSEKSVWEALSGVNVDETYDSALEKLAGVAPDEFHEWMHETADRYLEQYRDIQKKTWDEFQQAMALFPYNSDNCRKEFATRVRRSQNKDIMFALWDEKDPSQMIWKRLKPVGPLTTAFRVNSEQNC